MLSTISMNKIHLMKLRYLMVICTYALCSTYPVESQGFTWPNNTAENVGMDQQYIDAAINQIQSGTVGNMKSLIIIKDGQLITEKYFGNTGEMKPVYSVTKSIGVTLLGIAKYQGAEIDLAESIMTYMPQYNNISNYQQAQRISLHDLLTQRHGYNWDEWSTSFANSNNPVNKMLRSSDWYQFALKWPITKAPDQDFAYSSGHSSLMSPILYNRTGRDVYEFAKAELFEPLSIYGTHWELVNDGAGQGQGNSNFPYGLEPMGFGLWLRPIDMAKIGELYRLGGVWQNTRLLSEQWVNQATVRYSDNQSDPDVFNTHQGYGHQWWITQITDANNRPTDMYYANGYAGQFIFVIPQYDAVIVTTALDYSYSGPNIGTVLRDNLLLAFNAEHEYAIPLSADFNGSWYFPDHDGQGINFEVTNNGSNFVGYWYTYDTTGGNQRWFTLQGEIIDGKANFTIYSTSGGVFVDAQPIDVIEWGHGTLEVHDCHNGHFTFASDNENVDETLIGDFPLSRLTISTGTCLNNNKSQQHLGYGLR